MSFVAVATDSDFDAVVALVNSAYRGDSSRVGWTTEADYLDGQRTDAATLRADLAANPAAMLLLMRDTPDGELLGSVWLERESEETWYVGMLTVRPDLQDRKLGRTLLGEAEKYAAERGARRIELGVVQLRDTLIAWYKRRGYALTGEVRPFPYGDDRFGQPKRKDLSFLVMEKTL